MTVASATKENLDKSGSSPPRSSKQEAESAPVTSSVHSGYASDRRDADIAVNFLELFDLGFEVFFGAIAILFETQTSRSEDYRLLFRLPPDDISIFLLLTREPEVHVVTQGNQISSFSGYKAENIEWLEKRVDYLKEEMLMVETCVERMYLEHAMLKAHLQSLERPKPK